MKEVIAEVKFTSITDIGLNELAKRAIENAIDDVLDDFPEVTATVNYSNTVEEGPIVSPADEG